MGTWDNGAFDNDTAADFVLSLNEAAEYERLGMLREALVEVGRHEGYIDAPIVEVAVAAAALVARNLEGGEEFQSQHYGPKKPIPAIPRDLITIASSAVERIIVGENDVKEYWQDAHDSGQWIASMKRLQTILSAGSFGATDTLW
jgi:hypothetical protein